VYNFEKECAFYDWQQSGIVGAAAIIGLLSFMVAIENSME
jgi:hypothetical protein